MRIMDLGRITYADAWAEQGRVLERVIGGGPNTTLVCVHDPVFTVGRARNARASVLAPGDIPVVEVERGGDVTYHGPGQLVAYPIVRLEGESRDLHAHLRRLEGIGIAVCEALGLEGRRDARNTGVWVGDHKVVSVGIACRRWVTWHGLAINCDVDLSVYARIQPCGMPSDLTGSLSLALGRRCTVEDVRPMLNAALCAAF